MGYGKQIATDHLTDEQRELLAGGTEPLTRGNVWGSQFVLPQNPVGSGVTPPRFTALDIGPLEEPCELELQWRIDNPLPSTASNPPTITAEVTVGNGRSAYVEQWDLSGARANTLRRVVVAQSLRVAIARSDSIAQDYTVHVWATRRIAGCAPIVIASELVVFAAGVATVQVNPPPPNATYVQVTRENATTNHQLFVQQDGTGTQQLLLLYNASIGNPMAALNPRWNAFSLSRVPSAAAGEAEIQWLR